MYKHHRARDSASATKNHSRSNLGVYPHLYWKEVHASLRDMLEAGTIRPSQSPWCNALWCWYGRRMSLFDSALTSDDSTHGQRRIPIPLPRIQEALESMVRAGTLLHYGLQKWILAGPYGPRVTAVYRVHGWQPRILRVHQDALRTG